MTHPREVSAPPLLEPTNPFKQLPQDVGSTSDHSEDYKLVLTHILIHQLPVTEYHLLVVLNLRGVPCGLNPPAPQPLVWTEPSPTPLKQQLLEVGIMSDYSEDATSLPDPAIRSANPCTGGAGKIAFSTSRVVPHVDPEPKPLFCKTV